MPRHLSLLLLACVLTLPAWADTVYNEATAGDLSNNGFNPTKLTFTPGFNQVVGTTGAGPAGVDRDYFTFVVPAGYEISNLIELAGTRIGGEVSFLGLEAGPQLTLPTSATTAAGLLGWVHYGPAAKDIDLLPALRLPNFGATGFSSLPAGTYSVWIQDFNTGPIPYAFNIQLAATPEPATIVLLPTALLAGGILARRRRASH